jgi:hypothetical protein
MAVESSAVQISINVTDQNSAATVGKVTQNLNQMGMAGARAGQQVAQGMEQASGHVLTSLDNVRLLRQELGVHVPRAMEMLIAKNATLMKGISMLGPLMAGAGFAGIGVAVLDMAVTKVGDLYRKWLDVNGTIQRYNQQAAEAAQKKFDENRSLAQVNDDLRTANNLIDQLNQKKAKSQDWHDIILGPLMALGGEGRSGVPDVFGQVKGHFGVGDANTLNAAHGASDVDAAAAEQKRHEAALQRIRNQAVEEEAGLSSMKRAARERGASYAEEDENIQNRINTQKQLAGVSERAGLKQGQPGYVPEPGAHDFDEEKQAAYATADAKYNAARRENAVATQNELRRLQEEADEASMKGYQLLENQRKAADADFVREHGTSAAALSAIDRKYYAEEKKQAQSAAEDLRKMREETQLGGMTGVAKIQQQGRNRVADFEATDHPGMDPGQRLAMIHEMVQQTSQAVAGEQKAFADHVNQIMQESTDRTVSGFARIHAEAQREIEALRTEAGTNRGSPTDLARGEAGIHAGETAQVADLQRKNTEETEQLEAAARAKYLSAEKQQTAAIQTEYQERLEKFKEELGQQEISEDDYNRRVVAAAQLRDAQLVDSARQAREKMAGEFTSLFNGLDHPLKELQEMGNKVAGQAAAALMQRVQNSRGGSGTGGSGFDITNPFGGVFDKLAGKPRGYGEQPPQVATSGTHSIAVSQAAIHVGSASISLGGAAPTVTSGGRVGAPGAPGISFGGGTYQGGGVFVGAPAALASGGTYSGGSGSSAGPVPVSSGGTGAGAWGLSASSGSASGAWGSSGDASTSGAAGTGAPAALRGVGAPGAAQPIAPPASHELRSAVSDVQGGIGLVKQGAQIFGGGSGSSGAGGNAGGSDAASVLAEAQAAPGAHASLDTTDPDNPGAGAAGSGGNGGMLGGGGVGANAMGAVGGAVGLYSAYEGNGGVGGALSGAMSGMQLGMALGGPIGAAIGAAGGAVLGAIGMGGREKARVYDLKQVRPHIAGDEQSYETGSMDYLSAYSDMQSLDTTAERTTKQWGPAAHSYYNDTIRTEIAQARGKLDQMEKAGRSNFGASAAQYATGTDSVPAMLTPGERVIPSDQNERITRALENGASSKSRPVAPGFGGDVHLHVHTMDAGGVAQFLNDNKHGIRAAVNASYSENSGGADAGF